MHKRSQFRIVCFLLTIMLIVSCFVGCGCTKTDEATSNDTTTEAITVAPTTVAPTTVAPTTAKPTEKPTTAPTTQVIQESNSEVDNDTSEDTNYDSEDTNYEDEEPAENSEDNNSGNNSTGNGASYSPNEFQNAGVIDWGGWTWTYYSEQILPGEGLDIPGRWTDSDGYVCDGDGYVCLASTSVDRYSIVETPFGRTGKVYDSGCAYGVMDVYVNW